MTWGDQTLVGNTYTVANPVKEAGRFVRLAEKVVAPQTLDARMPELPPTPPRRERKIWELPATATAAQIQQALDEAAKLAGQRPVVHLPKGIYKIDGTLVVPAGCDVQIIGDGAAETATVLQWTGRGTGPVFRLKGPSRATLRDLSLQAGRASGSWSRTAISPGAGSSATSSTSPASAPRRTARGSWLRASSTVTSCFARPRAGTSAGGGSACSAGRSARPGKPAPGQVSVFCGATGTAEAQYHVAQGGRLVVRSVYHEVSGNSPQGILLDGAGALTVDTTRFSYRTSPGSAPGSSAGLQGRLPAHVRHVASGGHQVPGTARHRGRRLAVERAVPGQHVLGDVPGGKR